MPQPHPKLDEDDVSLIANALLLSATQSSVSITLFIDPVLDVRHHMYEIRVKARTEGEYIWNIHQKGRGEEAVGFISQLTLICMSFVGGLSFSHSASGVLY